MFSDIVGYTALMAQSETRALAARERHRALLGARARAYGGEVVDENGDELVLSFASAVDAVNCALAVQAEGIGDDAALRIGIHVGDVLFEGGRVYGDGVNLAARVRPFAPEGGVCVSDEVEHALRNQPNVELTPLGTPALKNVDRPVPLFAVAGDALPPAPRRWRPARRTLLVGVAVAAGIAALGLARLQSSRAPGSGAIPGFTAPAIAVLPFDNLSDGTDPELFAAGLVEDLTTRLARWGRFPVIARNSVFEVASRTPGVPLDVAGVGEELGARYVVEGSVRRVDDQVRITVQLIDAETGHHVWAEHYDEPYESLLSLQEAMSRSVAAALVSSLDEFEARQALQEDPESLDAWRNTQRGWWLYYRETPEDNAEARRFFERAIEQEPLWAPPHAGLALTHYKDRAHLWSASPGRSLDGLIASAERAVALGSGEPAAHHALGHAYAMSGKTSRMIGAFARGVELNPSDAMANNCLGAHLGHVGELDRAVEHLTRALALSPRDPRSATFLFNLASAHFATERYEEALRWAEASLARRPNANASQVAAASLALLGRLDEARDALVELLRLRPELSPAAIAHYYAVADPDLAIRLVEGLELAGWDPPEAVGKVFPQM